MERKIPKCIFHSPKLTTLPLLCYCDISTAFPNCIFHVRKLEASNVRLPTAFFIVPNSLHSRYFAIAISHLYQLFSFCKLLCFLDIFYALLQGIILFPYLANVFFFHFLVSFSGMIKQSRSFKMNTCHLPHEEHYPK